MLRRVSLVLFVVVLSLAVAVPALAGKPDHVGGGLGNKAPNFSAGVYADGEAWGTKGTTTLPAPNENNAQSFDKLFSFTNGVNGQLPVAEAAPGNPNYNGGRWSGQSVTWNDPNNAVLLTSYADIPAHIDELSIVETGNYFQCPLLPVK
jgi:hypothetical protein